MAEIIRSFAAVELPEALKEQMAAYIAALRPLAPNVKWVKCASFHLTLKFLGNQPAEKIDRVLTSLIRTPENLGPFGLSIRYFGAFPGRKQPRVFHLGLEEQPKLNALQQWVEDTLAPLGFGKERRRFSAHLTLGRVKVVQDFSSLWAFADKNPFPPFSFAVKDFVLMRSLLKPGGAEYRVLQKYSLHP